MSRLIEEHQHRLFAHDHQLVRESWNALASNRSDSRRLIAFFGSSNLFGPWSVQRQLSALFGLGGIRDVVLNLGSFGFGHTHHVIDQTLALIQSYRERPLDLLIHEFSANELPPLPKALIAALPRGQQRPMVLDHTHRQMLRDRAWEVSRTLKQNIERLAEVAAARRFRVLTLDHDWNLGEWPPTLSAFSKPVSARDATHFVDLLEAAIGAVRAGRFDHARPLLDDCNAIDGDVAMAKYLEAKLAEAEGDFTQSERLYRSGRAADLMGRGVALESYLPELQAWCTEAGFWHVSVPEVVRRCSLRPTPGFDVFLDGDHYVPEVHGAIARAIAGCLCSHGFLAEDLTSIDVESLAGAVAAPSPTVWLQAALNLALAPPAAFNDERVTQGRRYLSRSERLGADVALVEEYRARFEAICSYVAPPRDQASLPQAKAISSPRRVSRELGNLHLTPATLLTASVEDWSAQTIDDVLTRHFRDKADDLAVTLLPSGANSFRSATRLTWAALDRLSSSSAAFWQACGATTGDTVLLTGHGEDTIGALLGAIRLGLVVSFADETSPSASANAAGMLARTMLESDAKFALASPEVAEVLRTQQCPAGRCRVLSTAELGSWRSHGQRPAPAFPALAPSTSAVADRRGVSGARTNHVLSNRAVMRHVWEYARAVDLRAGDHLAACVHPHRHEGLLGWLVMPLLAGTPTVVMSQADHVASPNLLLEAITADNLNLVWLPNWAMHLLTERVAPAEVAVSNVSSVRAFINTGLADLLAWERLYGRFAAQHLSRFAHASAHSAPESVFYTTQGGIDEPVFVDVVDSVALFRDGVAVQARSLAPNVLTIPSSGRVVGSSRLRIVDRRQGAQLPERRVGLIEIESETRANDWSTAGDVGYSAEGFLFVLGRDGETIDVTSGNVPTSQVENVVSCEPGVLPGRVVVFTAAVHGQVTSQPVILAEVVDRAIAEDVARGLCVGILARLTRLLSGAEPSVFLLRPLTLAESSPGTFDRRQVRELFIQGHLDEAFVGRPSPSRAGVGAHT